jgi:hypothetical protein
VAGGGRESRCGTPAEVPAEQRLLRSWPVLLAEAVAPGAPADRLDSGGCGDRGGGGHWQGGGGRRQALQEGIRSGGTPIRSPHTVQRIQLSGLSARARLSTRAGDAGG